MDRISVGGTFRSATVNDFLLVSQNMVPTVPSLEKICAAFGITLSQLFAEGDTVVSLTDSQKKLLEHWARLSEDQQNVVFQLIDKM